MSAQLETPVISLTVENNTTIRVSGLSVEHASGYQVKIGTLSGGAVAEQVYPVDGAVSFNRLYPRSIYYVQARALGDDENYENSDWCTEQTIVTGAVIDQTMEIPQISATTESFTTIKIAGLVQYAEYRYQIATTSAGLESAPIKNTGNSGGYMYIRGLEPGTTYYIRFCKVDMGRCSLWSDVISGSTEAVTNTITVTSGNDSGDGTLRQAVTDATSGTKIILDVDTITLNSVISNTTKHLFIIGGKTERTTIQSGNNNALFTITYLSGRHLRFTGNVGSAIAITNGHYDDCAMDSVITTGSAGFASSAGFTNSAITGCVSGNNALRYGENYDTVIDGCYNTVTNADGGGANSAVLNNCLIRNCTAIRNGGGAYYSTLTNCTLTSNSAGLNGGGAHSSTLTNCTIIGNTASQSGGGASNGTLTNCTITGNTGTGTAASHGGGGVSSCTVFNCVITGNHAVVNNPQGGGTWQATVNNCLVTNNTYGANRYKSDVAEGYNVVIAVRDSTVGYLHVGTDANVSLYNTLYKSRSKTPTGADSNNLSYDGLEDDYFLDAANGDYRLKYGSPAINAGDNQYVTTETDLAGNPRINGTTVDVGAYEYESYKLDAPTFNLTAGGSGECEITFTLPLGASAFKLQYADNADFTGAQELSSASSAFDLSGLSGLVYFRGQAVGISGVTLDSDWTSSQNYYFDVEAPVIVMAREPIEMTLGDTVDFLAGVSVSDDHDPNVSVHYQIIDRYNQPVVVDGQDTDIPSSGIPIGNYVLKITASDNVGNTAVADRGLAVLPPILQAPTISIQSSGKYSAEVSGLINTNASGWLLKVDGTEQSVSPVNGKATITGLDPSVAHVVQAKALGDWVQPEPPTPPSGSWRDSAWSNEVSVSFSGVAFFQWVAETVMSHDGRTYQNVELKAKIKDADTGELLPKAMVTGATFTAYYVDNGERVEVEGFTGLEVPLTSFSESALDDGCNFHYVPGQTAQRLLRCPGYYIFQVAVTLTAGNPFTIYSEPVPIF